MTTVAMAKSFFDSANRFEFSERGRIFDFVTKFHENPAHPGLSIERVERAKAAGLWSGRVNDSLRAIFHHDGSSYTLLWVDKHDPAYEWAQRRRASMNPKTGELQVIVVPELVQEAIARPAAVAPAPVDVPPLFSAFSDDYLTSIGFPQDWLPTLRLIRTEAQLDQAAKNLPEELSERLFKLALGEVVTPPPPPAPAPATSLTQIAGSPAEQRYWVIRSASDIEELRNKPIEAWMRYLHPSQKEIVERAWSGPAKVTGAAGTGKTVVAMHRARHLARQGKKVLLTSFVTTLCRNLDRALKVLCTPEEKRLITVSNVDTVASRILGPAAPRDGFATDDEIKKAIGDFSFYAGSAGDAGFLSAEWQHVIEPQGILTWAAYRDAVRTGRGKALSVQERKKIWESFQRVLDRLSTSGKLPAFAILRKAEESLVAGQVLPPWDAIIVDEVQDLSPSALRFLSALGKHCRTDFMLVGDGAQRIYRSRFSLMSVGIDVRGRSKTLKLNYRNTRQIQRAADRFLEEGADDLDDGMDDRKGTLSPLGGPDPVFSGFATAAALESFLIGEIQRLVAQGVALKEMAVFARTGDLVRSTRQALTNAGIKSEPLEKETDLSAVEGINVGTMHRAKGLEFKAVFLVHVSDDHIPSPGLLKRTTDPVDRKAAIEQERNLLYVALTRARDEAFVLWTGKPSSLLTPALGKQETASP